MHVVLVNPPPLSDYDKHWARFPVLGLAYVASALRRAGHQVSLLDGKLGALGAAAIRDRVAILAPDLVGITCMTVEYPEACRLAKLIKDVAQVPIVIGGAHVNAVGVRALEECSALDFACIDEGEALAPELARALAQGGLDGVKGLAWRNGDQIVFNGDRAYPDDYDALPFPAWDLFALGEQVPILTHRGCPFHCNFCGHNSGFEPRYRTPENVLDEIADTIARYRPRTIRFEDETFGLNLPRTKRMLRGILERGFEREVRFSAQTRVDRTDADFVDLLKRCNFETLEIGVESGNQAVLKRTRKGITLDQVERAVRLAKEAGIEVWCKFILGHPEETLPELLDTVRFIAKLNPDRLSVSIMTPFPGTPIYDLAVRGEGGYRMLSTDWRSFDKYSNGALELEGVSLGRLKALQLWAYARMYAQNGRLAELLGLVMEHRGMAIEMVRDTARKLLRPRPPAAPPRERSVGARADHAPEGRDAVLRGARAEDAAARRRRLPVLSG